MSVSPLPSHFARSLHRWERPNGPAGLNALPDQLHGWWVRMRPWSGLGLRRARRLTATASALSNLDEATFDQHITEQRQRVRRAGRDWLQHLDTALPLVAEAARRTVGLTPHPEQVLGALGLSHGRLIEMETGEGKSLTCALRAVMAGWQGRPCHCLTVNDYLATRDAAAFAPLFARCGLGVAAVTEEMPRERRIDAYSHEIVYTTSKGIVADYLRDRLLLGRRERFTDRLIDSLLDDRPLRPTRMVLRGLDIAIIDEADSVLLDEAVTPVVISGRHPDPDLAAAVQMADQLARALTEGSDFRLDRRLRQATLLPPGRALAYAVAPSLPPAWRPVHRAEELVREALIARQFYRSDRDYVVRDDRIVIVDESTGRLMPARSWSVGRHQAIEAAEGVPISDPTHTLTRLSFQAFFRRYRALSGMTGTAAHGSAEFWQVYRLPVLVIPPHKPSRLRVLPDRIFLNGETRWQAVIAEIEACRAAGRPVLAGTRTVHQSRTLGDRLASVGIHVKVLNALSDAEEAAIIAAAGDVGQVTVGTNVAGRGTDIRPSPQALDAGGLHVIATERQHSPRIDRQLFGRAGRQGAPGSAVAFVALDDALLTEHAPASLRCLVAALVAAGLPGGRRVGRWLARLAQIRADAKGRARRRRLGLTTSGG